MTTDWKPSSSSGQLSSVSHANSLLYAMQFQKHIQLCYWCMPLAVAPTTITFSFKVIKGFRIGLLLRAHRFFRKSSLIYSNRIFPLNTLTPFPLPSHKEASQAH